MEKETALQKNEAERLPKEEKRLRKSEGGIQVKTLLVRKGMVGREGKGKNFGGPNRGGIKKIAGEFYDMKKEEARRGQDIGKEATKDEIEGIISKNQKMVGKTRQERGDQKKRGSIEE